MENQEKIVPSSLPNEKKSAPSKWTLAFIFLTAIFISAVAGAVFGFIGGGFGQKITAEIFKKYPAIFGVNKESDLNREIIKQQVINEDSAVIDVVEKTAPAVVSIVISKQVPKFQDVYNYDPFDFEDFFDYLQKKNQNSGKTEKKKIGGGSGFLISRDGMIITNKHVVDDDGADYTVITNDGKEHPAKVLAKDPSNDIAVIKIDGTDFPILDLGDSDALKTGQTVIAIGNSLGEFSNTVSKGIVSGLKRNLTAESSYGETEKLSDIIQTDAAINLGNSGGPLLNINREVVGINVAMAEGAENVGFAIPVNQIKKVVEQIKTTGKISSPYLGVRYIPIDAQIQKENNLPYGYGALVVRGEKVTDFAVIPGSPADKAGIGENNIILEINGTKIDEKNSLARLIASHNVGEEITVKIWQKGMEKELKIKLEERK